MLLTSWVKSMRVAFEKSRKATLNPRRRLQLRSMPSSARQKIQRRVAIEQLEDRTLLTTLIINQLTSGLGVTLDNSVLDPNSDGISEIDTIIFEDLTISATSGPAVSIDIDGLEFRDSDDPSQVVPFQILFDNVTISSSTGIGVDIELSDILVDTIAVDSSTISGSVGNAFNLDMTNATSLNEFNIIDSTISGGAGAGVTVALNASTIEETSIRRSTIDGVSIDVTNGAVLRHTTMADNSIAGTNGSDGVSLNLVDSIAEEFRLTNNNAIQGVSINVDDTIDGDAALLTELYIHSNTISGNTEGAGVSLTLNNVDQFVSITENSITSNSGHGVVFDQTDGDLSGAISDNVIANNVGHGIFFTPSTTNPIPTGDGAPGVPAYAGVPGPTDKIDFAAPRNEVQLVTFAGEAIGGNFQLRYMDNQGVQHTTADIPYTATAAEVKVALVAMGSDITVDDILVNGNFQDGYEIEFVNDLAGQNMNLLEVVNSTLTFQPPLVFLAQDTTSNVSEVQEILFSGIPAFGTYTLFFLGQSATFAYDATAMDIQDELITLAENVGYIGADIVVTSIAGGFEIAIVDDHSNPLAYIDIDQIIPNSDGLNFTIAISEQTAGSASVNEEQLLEINSPNSPVGQQFFLTFGGVDTGLITIDPDNATTRANIDSALEAAFGTTGDEFTVSGTLAAGFVIEFTGDLELTDHPLLQATWPPGITINAFTTTPGVGVNEIQQIFFPTQPGGGDFTLTLDTETTVSLPFDATADAVQSALEDLPNIGVGNVSVTKTFLGSAFVYQVEFIGTNYLRPADYLANPAGTLLTIDPSNLIAAVPAVTAVAEGTSLNEIQEVVISDATGGDFILSFDGQDTGVIAYNADAAAILGELEMIPVLDGNVLVRGDAMNGFEIEFIGTLATINVPQITADVSGLSGATTPSIVIKTTSVGGYLRGIRGNTITGNSGAGVEVDLEMFTSFYGDLTGNTISSNNTAGINLEAADTTILHSIDFSLSVDDSTMDGNRGAGVAVSLQDTATGDISITNNTITGTSNDLDVSTPYGGDAIYVDLFGTDVHFEAFSQLRDLTIDGNFLGTDAANTGGLGNAANGIGIHIEESTIIDRTQISNNVIANNAGDGVNFHREDDARVGRAEVNPIVGEERAVMIYSNTITGNSDGIDILAQNGNLTTTDFEIKDNVLSTNVGDGVSLHAEADATIIADIINNQLTLNGMNGIESTTRSTSYDGTDRRDVAGTWIQNDISNNTRHGVRISGRLGNRDMLFIGLDGVDPVTSQDRGNLIQGNGRDGIQVAAHFDPVDGNVKIANNSILANLTGGIELSGGNFSFLGKELVSSIDNNLIAFNNGKGIDINSNGQTSFIRGNTITENSSDGLEILSANSISFSEDGQTRTINRYEIHTSVTVIGNFIDNNAGRGVDLQTEERGNSDFIFGDGTEAGANRIVSNALEGFYVVTTASQGQDQDANSTAAFDATGSTSTSDADMVLQVNTNYIQDNGVNSSFSANGLILRIGTMAANVGSGAYFTQDPFSRSSVGDESGGNASNGDSNGRSNVSVTGNIFEGNYGEDVYIDSFTSTVDPNTTADIWEVTATPSFRVLSSYQRDPLAKLNLVFEENTGNGLNVVNFGAYYDNAEGLFKSRLRNGAPAPNPDGDFTSATRRRNAQRVASRAGWNPTTAPNLAPDVGLVQGASIDPVSGRILIQSDDVSVLANGYTVQITGSTSGRATQLPVSNPAFGVFRIDDIDYNANTFTLVSTEGADLTGFFTFGAWSTTENNSSFVFDGTGVSTFRVAQGSNNNNFQSGDDFFNEIISLGGLTGEQGFSWDTWVPDTDSFLVPAVNTFLTADISVTVPDPSNVTAIGDFTISFTEDVTGVDISDFQLFRDNVDISGLLMASMLTQDTLRNFTLNIDSIIAAEGDGEYELRLNADGSITDLKYSSTYNPLLFGDVERFTVDQIAPTAEFEEVELVMGTPISGAASQVVLNFSEEVTGVELSDFTLTFDDGSGVVNQDLSVATLTQVTGSQFVLNLSKVTSLTGDYDLTLNTGGSITDLAGNAIQVGDDVSWRNDTQAPAGSFAITPTDILTLTFLEDVSGVDISDFKLFNGNTEISLGSTIADPISSTEYELDLSGLALGNGDYTLVFVAENSGVVDDAGNHAASPISFSWIKGADLDAPTVGIQIQGVPNDGTPLPSGTSDLRLLINFSEIVTNVDDHNGTTYTNFELLFDDGTGSVPIDIPIQTMLANPTLMGSGAFYTLDLDAVQLTGNGVYTLTVLDGATATENEIEDFGGNTLIQGATETWRIGDDVLGATFTGLPTPPATLLTDAGVVTVTFSNTMGDPVTGVEISDFRLTRNGQNVPLPGPVTGSGSTYQIDLSTVTDVPGAYTLTLVAEGSDILADTRPLLDDFSVNWVTGSIISVTEISDGVDATAGDGIVGAVSGDPASQTLRAAIQEANALVGSNVIELGSGVFQLDRAGIDEDLSATGDLDIRDNLTIRGTGVAVFDDDGTTLLSGTAIDGGAIDRIFQIFAGVTLNLENLTITNGALTGSADGAGIRNSGTTTLTNVEVTGNVAEDSGGGINSTGTMIIVDSTISDNMATGGSGGGIRNTGDLTVIRSTLSGNSTGRDGGAIFNAGAGDATLSNATFSGNSSTRSGGAIRNTATISATNNTFTLNTAGTNGGAISNSSTFTHQNNLVFGNTATSSDPELQGDYLSLGGNLVGTIGLATGFGALDTVDVLNTEIVLDSTLADNGGPTLTHALILGSIAIDAGVDTDVDELEQRGSTRILGSSVDIGAVEFGAFFVDSLLDTVDASPGDGIAEDADGNRTLRAAIMEANALAGDSVIMLGPGLYDLSILNEIDSDLDDSTTGDLDITDVTGSLTIVGVGNGQTIINASSLADRVFDVLVGADLILEGVTVTGGHAVGESGGGIRNVGTLSLLNSIVNGNTADVDGGGILNGEVGREGILTLTNSTVSNNSAVDGAGIFNNVQSVVTLNDSEVLGNTASHDGGGFFNAYEAIIDVTRSSISGNTAIFDGGGLYNNDQSSLTITDSKVNNNTADQGGGIFTEESASLTVNRTTLSGNIALLHGGGIFNDEGMISLSEVSLLNNTAAFDGGGFYNASAGEVTITDSLFDDNTADRDGGAIANFGVSLSVTGTVIRDSEALGYGGGLFNDQEEGAVNLTSTSLINNEAIAGAGIYNRELGTVNLDLSSVNGNISSTDGGGIYNTDDAILNLHQTTIDGNIAANNGAGIFNDYNAQLNVSSSTVSNNSAARFGGGIYNNSIALSALVNATVSGNDAEQGGGVYNDEEGSMDITNATIYNNTATVFGGGVQNEIDGFVSVANSIIAGNNGVASSPDDVRGDFGSLGNNLIGDEGFSSNGFDVGLNDIVGPSGGNPINPGLGALQDNGGATFTHEVLDGSLARDAGNNFYAPVDDQRGFARLFDGDGNGSLVVDMGAFESGYIVTAFGDSVDAVLGDGVSVDINGQSTLRAAVMEANARAGADTILLGSGVYTLSLFGQLEDNALWGDLDITDDLTIIGVGSGRTTIDADFLDRIFHIFTDVNVSIRGVTLVNGSVTRVEDGGAILNFGNLTLEDVTIENSLANRGGALFNNGIVTMTDSFFQNNTAIADGGAIFNSDFGTMTIDLSTISGNDAENGGGIFNSSGGTLVVNATTIDDNTATVAGGGVFTSNEVAIGNGEGGSGVVAGSEPENDHVYPVYDSGYEEHHIPKFENGDAEAAILSEVPPFPVSDTFNLSSLPGASHTIYLDFDGHTTTGTQWNNTYGTIVTPAYDTDGNVGSFSVNEIEVIQRTWLQVAEDFAPFNVNVTTVEPPVSDLIRSDASDTRWGIRVVIGENTWYSNAGGVAYVGSFTSSVDTPTYVFNSGLIGVAEAASHEVGHTLGLVHDGTSSLEYYQGHGSGPTGWAPIMGVGYYQNLVQWSSGEYTDADNGEDDLSIITTQNGFGYRTDDHGSSTGTATSIDEMASGIVERNTDVDYFQFTTTGGDVIIDPAVQSPNLDILANLYDSTGTQIQTSNPIGDLNASFIGLSAGTYFVSIEGTGEGDVLGTGYSDYASLGQYTIMVGGSQPPPPPPPVITGSVAISNSTISYNTAGTRGGGLLNEDTVDISNVTFSGNEAGKEGGAIHNTGELTINNTTIYDNATEGYGGGIYSVAASASVSVKNTIVAGNQALVSGADVEGDFTSQGNNLIGTKGTTTAFIDGFNNDIVGSDGLAIDPALSPLQDNGGPTLTHALLAGSLALDAGDNTDGVVTDQRGASRPTDTTSDIGAYEFVTPTISISDHRQLETSGGGTTTFEVLVSLSNVYVDAVTVDYETSNGTATAGEDYAFTTGTVTFLPGDTTQKIEVTVFGDDLAEYHETFFVNLFNSVGALIDDAESEVTIVNDEAEVSIVALSQDEGDAGSTEFPFIVELSGQVDETVTVDVATLIAGTGSTFADADDFVLSDPFTTQTVTFAPGVTVQYATILVNGDTEIEEDETFQVDLGTVTVSGTANVVLDTVVANTTAVGTIENDDLALLSINDVTIVEPDTMTGTRDMIFTVSLSQSLSTPLTFDVYTTAAGTLDDATAGDDYVSVMTGTTESEVTIAAGATSETFTVTINDDMDVEDYEFFKVVIDQSTVSGATVLDGEGIGTIVDAGSGLLVNTPLDIVDMDLMTLSLREAINMVNENPGVYDTIVLPAGEYLIELPGAGEDDNASGDFDIKANISIVGDGANLTTIDAEGLDRIFHTHTGVALELIGMELINGDAIDGGALFLRGASTTLDQVIFRDNKADFFGGAIDNEGMLDITNTLFINNHAGYQGGALYQGMGTATVGNSTFDGNTSDGRAGAVYVASAATLNVSAGSIFTNNEAGSRGGAIYNEGMTSSTDTTFSENQAGSRGGAIFNAGTGTLDVMSNVLAMNTAGQSGGGIHNAGVTTSEGTTFSGNQAGANGGGIYNEGGTVNSTNTTYSANQAGANGGAIFNGNTMVQDGTLDIENNTLVLNTAIQAGGGIYNEGTTNSINATFSANHAGTRGGGIYNDGLLHVVYNTLTLNTADLMGGGISNQGRVSMFNTIVAGNSAVVENDDLDGDYTLIPAPAPAPAPVLSQNNLIGNIGIATGLTDGVNGNIVGSSGSPIDAMLDVLADNGGLTQTHALLAGSLAINAALLDDGDLVDNDNLIEQFPMVDQRGETRPSSGVVLDDRSDIGAYEFVPPLPPPLFGTRGNVALAEEHTSIQISVVTEQTATESDGHTLALPANANWIHEWDSFWVEVWVNTASGLGISDALTEIAYNTAYFTATSVEFGSSFAINQTAVIDEGAGIVRNLGGSTSQSEVGSAGHALLARIKFESLAGDQVEVDSTALTFGPLDLGLNVLNTVIDVTDVGEVTANVGELPQTDLYPVIYDVNDDNEINFRDLMFFASVYSQDVYSSSSEFVTVMDYDKSGRVDFRDLTMLAANYGKKKDGNSDVNFPTNFGQKWIGTSLEVDSGDDSIDQVIEAAVGTWETALGLDEPLEVQVIVRDFGTAQLGSGQTTEYSVDGIPVGGRVVIDDDANGLGWHVDVTDLPTGNDYDLYTVLLHEIGHVLGFTRYYSGFGSHIEADNNGDLIFVGSDFTVGLDAIGYHIDDPAHTDDLMSDTLDPGVRKTLSDLDVQMLLEAYQSVGADSGSGPSSPIFGTNSVPTAVAEPTVVQSVEAAKVFVEQSTVSVVAPAAIKNSEEDGSLATIQQAASFDAIQPSLIEQGTPFERPELDETVFEDLYSTEFEDSLTGSDSDDQELVFAHSENELADDFGEDLDSMDEAFSNWNGPLL